MRNNLITYRRSLKIFGAFVLLIAALGTLPANADKLQDIELRVKDTNTQIQETRHHYMKKVSPRKEQDLERQLQKGLVLLEMGDATRASIVFLEIANQKKWKAKPGYTHSFLLLGRALHLSENHHTAREWLRKSLAEGNSSEREEAAALMIQIAIDNRHSATLKDWEELDLVFNKLAKSMQSEELLYARGKGLYIRAVLENDSIKSESLLNKALQSFNSIQATTLVGLRALYFSGIIQSRRANQQYLQLKKAKEKTRKVMIAEVKPSYDKAITSFKSITNNNVELKETPELRSILDLTATARARIHYEMGELNEALESYNEVERDSPFFDQILFEITWTHIALKNFDMALRHIDILLLSQPDSLFVPDAKRLRADLLKNKGDFEGAISTYEELLETFDPVLTELNRMIETAPTPQVYFQELVEKDTFGNGNYLPNSATRWLPRDERMEEAKHITSSLGKGFENIEESEVLIREIEAAISSENRFQLFPEIKEGWLASLALENRILLLQRDINALERSSLSDNESSQAAHTERENAQKDFNTLPQNRDEFAQRVQKLRNAIEARKLRTYRLRTIIEGAEAQVVVMERWLMLKGERVGIDPQKEAELRSDLTESKEDVSTLKEDLRTIEHQLRVLETLGGVDASLVKREMRIKKDFKDSLQRERESMASIRGNSPEIQRLDELRKTLEIGELDLLTFKKSLSKGVDEKIREVQKKLQTEKELLSHYQANHDRLKGDVNLIAGSIAFQHWAQIRETFTDLVLAADVGVVDVAWLRKEKISQRLTRLKAERNKETEILEQDYRQVLQESGTEQ